MADCAEASGQERGGESEMMIFGAGKYVFKLSVVQSRADKSSFPFSLSKVDGLVWVFDIVLIPRLKVLAKYRSLTPL